jgi:hemerythrin-like metal-binding protein
MFMQINEEEHRAIYAILDKLQEIVDRPPVVIVRELLEEIKQHFAHEEAWMLRYNYPDYPNHKQAHEAYLKLLTKFYNDIQSNPSILPDRIDMIKHALDSHKDTEMVAFAVHVSDVPPAAEI